jgi:hypothetical protein
MGTTHALPSLAIPKHTSMWPCLLCLCYLHSACTQLRSACYWTCTAASTRTPACSVILVPSTQPCTLPHAVPPAVHAHLDTFGMRKQGAAWCLLCTSSPVLPVRMMQQRPAARYKPLSAALAAPATQLVQQRAALPRSTLATACTLLRCLQAEQQRYVCHNTGKAARWPQCAGTTCVHYQCAGTTSVLTPPVKGTSQLAARAARNEHWPVRQQQLQHVYCHQDVLLVCRHAYCHQDVLLVCRHVYCHQDVLLVCRHVYCHQDVLLVCRHALCCSTGGSNSNAYCSNAHSSNACCRGPTPSKRRTWTRTALLQTLGQTLLYCPPADPGPDSSVYCYAD